MKKITLKAFVLLFFVGTLLGFSQSTINITTSGGSFPTEKWVSITTDPDGAGTQVYGQGNGTQCDGAGLINEDIMLAPGTYYVNCYDQYDDGWDGTLITVTAYGTVIGDNGGVSPSDGEDTDADFTCEGTPEELEVSFEIIVPNPPACPDPSDLTLSSVDATSADIAWTAGGSETSWNLEWKAGADFTPGNAEEDASTSVGTEAFNPTTLTAQTEYYLYVQADCGGGDTSDWVGPLFFITNECFTSGTFDYTNNSGSADSVGFTAVTPGDNIILTFTAGSTESCCDEWFVTDAADGTGNVIDSGFGSIVGSYESTSGEISFYVDSDGSVTGTTFEYTVSCVTPSTDTPDYFNVQFPATGTIEAGDEFLVFAQVYEAGLTDASATPAAGIEAWIGYSEVDSSPDTLADWTWVPASTNPSFDFSQNNDEYFLDLGAEIGATGTYYYASRWSLNNGPFVYGGILADGSGGGEWGQNGWASGVLTVNPPANDECANATLLECGTPLTNQSTIGATGGSSTSCVGSMGNDVWYVFNGNDDEVELVLDASVQEGQIGVYESTDGTCGGFTLGTCIASGGSEENPVTVNFSALAGNTYYIRVGNWINGDPGVNFDLSATCSPICFADAGTLTADASAVELDGTTTISATPNGDINVPTDYEVTYVLTEGTSLVIQDVSTTAPSFDVTTAGEYTIHTLVAETSDNTDPNFLDLSVVVPGTTTGGDVLDIINDNNLCASLDVAGAPISVAECIADAGTLNADASPVSLSGTATISATPNGDIVVPTDYEVTYVLTEGASLVIQDVSTTAPSFEVTAAGEYTIHTLVAETSDNADPDFLDLSVVVFGTTTGGDVLDIISDNSLCASLDVTGAPITVIQAPSNDDCATATSLTQETGIGDAASATAITGTLEGATDSGLPAELCNGFAGTANDDVWYSFEALTSDVTITTDDGAQFVDLVVVLYSGSCGALAVEGCDDSGNPEEISATGLTVGDTYYFRVFQYGTGSTSGDDITVKVWSSSTLSTTDFENDAAFSYYPNPVKNTLTLNAQNNIEQVTMYNMLGQEVLRATPNTVDSDLDMSQLQTGTYFVKVTIANSTATIRVIKE